MQDHRMSDDTFRRGAEVLARLSPEGAKPPWVSFADVAPVLGGETGFAFGRIVARPGLDLRTRELLTVCMLAVLGGCEPQVAFHAGAALRAGATAPEIVEALTQVSIYAGIPRALNAVAAARQAFADQGVSSTGDAPRAVVASFLGALSRGDQPAALGLLADDVRWSLPGDPRSQPWAGTWGGRDNVATFQAILEEEVEIEDLRVGDPVASAGDVYVPGSLAIRSLRQGTSCAASFVAGFAVRDGRIAGVVLYSDGGEIVPEGASNRSAEHLVRG